MAKEPKRHHYVPQMYLRNFADARSQIAVFDRKDNKKFTTNISNVAAESQFYSTQGKAGEWTTDFESALSQFEGHVAPAIGAIVQDDVFPPTEEHREILALFIASQWMRTPRVRDEMAQMADHLAKMQFAIRGKAGLRDAMVAAGMDATDEAVDQQWAEWTDFDSYELRPHQNDHIKYLGKSVEEAAGMLRHASYCLVRFSKRKLLTSDGVVGLFRPPRPENEFLGMGLLTADEIHVPLARDVALILLPRDDLHGHRFPSSVAMANHINLVVGAYSRRWIFHHPEDAPLAGIDLPPWSEMTVQVSQKPEDFLPTDDHDAGAA